MSINIGNIQVGDDHPCFIVAEIGINHNGSLEIAKKLIDTAASSGCNAVKFQKRTPEICVPLEQRNKMRETPWGYISYMDYREKMEFGPKEYKEIDKYCKEKGIQWFVSCWDETSVDFIQAFDPPCIKIPSACLTDKNLLKYCRSANKPVILSTGMSDLKMVEQAIETIGPQQLILLHTNSSYPAKLEELNLKAIQTLKKHFNIPVGYSGHEVGLVTTVAAVVLGACMVERHITLDRASWGSDHAASMEPKGLTLLVRDIRNIEIATGDGIKRIYQNEIPLMKRLRRF